jgi:hypothetical protein
MHVTSRIPTWQAVFSRPFSLSRLGGAMVRVLAIGPKIRRFTSGRGDGFLRAIKIRSTTSFGVEVKPSAPCRKILRHVKDHFEVWTKIFRRPNLLFLRQAPPDLLLPYSARELWWKNQEFSPADIIPPWLSMLIYHLGGEQYTCWWSQFRDSLTPSTWPSSSSSGIWRRVVS